MSVASMLQNRCIMIGNPAITGIIIRANTLSI